MTIPTRVVRLYRSLLALLPRSVRAQDSAEIGATFEALWADAERERRRGRMLRRAFGGLARAIVLEWWDLLRMRQWQPADGQRRRRLVGNGLMQLRNAIRSLTRTPSFALSTVLLLGLGVGSVTAIFTLVDHVLLRPLPYPHAERLVKVQNGSHSGPVFADLQQFRSVERWAAAYTDEANLTSTAQPENVVQARISRDFFSVFGARPMLGRLPATEEFRSGDGAVLSAGAWRRLFGSDRDVVGRTIVVNDQPVAVIGVVAEDFVAPESMVGSSVDVWRPIDPAEPFLQVRTTWILSVVGLVAPNATRAMVEQEAAALAQRRAREFPDQYRQENGQVSELPIESLQEATVGEARKGLKLILGAVGLLLLVACTNVAHLFMARGLARTREFAVRRALGAGFGTIAGQLLLESLLIGAGGATLGIALATIGVRTFVAMNPIDMPRVVSIGVDLRILGFACALAAATALLFGLLPALRVVGRDVADRFTRAAARIRKVCSRSACAPRSSSLR